MRIAWKVVAAGVLCGAAVATTGILAQQPERKGAQPAQPKKDFQDRRPGDGRPGEGAMKPDPAVDAWVKVLLEKVTDPHDTIRESARAGLVSVGRPAIPALQKLADGDDGAKATAARKLIATIQAMEQRQGGGFGGSGFGQPFGGGPGGFPSGAPPFGPGGQPMQPGQPGQPAPSGEGVRPGPGGQPGRPGGFGSGQPGGPYRIVEQVLPDLKLADKELKQVKELIEKAQKEAQEIFAEAREKNVGREELREAMEKMNRELMKGLKAVLSDEQFQKVERAVQDRGPGGGLPPGTRPKNPDGGRPPE